jgi:hypothetical protein
MGVDRSTSVKSTWPKRAASMPCRTAAPLPRFGLDRRTTTGSHACADAAATSAVPSVLPSSTTMISAGSPRRLAYSITRGSVPGSRRASLYAGTTIDSPEPSLPQPSFC